jgi:threonine/homoserine/homoserine lactone efflux protein
MYSVVGSLIPLAFAVAFSPLPIIATILMLLSPRAKLSAVLFLVGWAVGIGTVLTLFALVADYLPQGGSSGLLTSIIRIMLGIALLGLAVRNWTRRDTPKDPPKWLASLSSVPPARSLLLGLALGGANPKNLLIGIAAGLVIGTAALPTGQQVAAVVLYTVLASFTVIVPVLGYLIAGGRMREPLIALKDWLERNSSVIVGVLFLIFGFVLIGNGIADF